MKPATRKASVTRLRSTRVPRGMSESEWQARLDLAAAFTRLGLEQHISMNRRNGFYSMVERIKAMAKAELTQA